MQFILDHLTSLIISSAVLLIVVAMQVRGSFNMVETHIAEVVTTELQAMHDILEWEISMMPTATYTNDAQTTGRFHGPAGSFRCSFTHSGGNTTSFTFPTFDMPYGIADSLRPPFDSVDVIEVRYDLVPYGDSLFVRVDTVDQYFPLFRLERFRNDTLTGYLNEIITDFSIQQVSVGGGPNGFTEINGGCPTDMKNIRYEYRIVTQGIDYTSKNQRSTSRLNQGQFGMTVDLQNW